MKYTEAYVTIHTVTNYENKDSRDTKNTHIQAMVIT